jgi:glycolate oxidase iron-sulfur subunit
MRTNFTEQQLAEPEIAEANRVLATCVHYGFCTNTCPTYVLTCNENESPRGRIDLIKAMLEHGGAPSARTVQHLDSCLSCLSCMTTCAAKVDYAHLVDIARAYIEHHYRRPWSDRIRRQLLAQTLPHPRRFRAAVRLGRAARRLRAVVPAALRPLVDLIPKRIAPDILRPQVFRADGTRARRVALLAGCAQQVLDGNINAATIRVLQRHGCDVVLAAGIGCCGSLTLHMGRVEEARAAARRTIRAWSREISGAGLDAIVINASGCGTTVKDYAHLLARDVELEGAARAVAERSLDVTELLVKLGVQGSGTMKPYRVAYHDPCSLQHGQKVIRPPRDLLRAAGFQVLDVPEGHFCCGSAGTYNLLQPNIAGQLGRRKAEHIRSTDPDIVATGNIGCMTQLKQYLDGPVVHTVELIDWATGGPMPPTLRESTLREPTLSPRVAADGGAEGPTPPQPDDVGFW